MDAKRLREACHQLATKDGVTETGLDGVLLYRVSYPLDRLPAVYSPQLCLNVSGSKRVFQSGRVFEYGENHFVCCTMPLPVDADVPKASKRKPLLGVSLEFDEQLMTETVIEMSSSDDGFRTSSVPSESGLIVSKATGSFLEAICRLLELAGEATATKVLGRGRLKEAYFELLRSEAGPLVRHRFGERNEIASAICFLKENLRESFSIDELAERAGMSRAVFHRKFKELTSLSPVQFVKTLRLNTAAMHLASGISVNEAASQVGYASPSQFSREFKRQFGMTPREWEQEADLP